VNLWTLWGSRLQKDKHKTKAEKAKDPKILEKLQVQEIPAPVHLSDMCLKVQSKHHDYQNFVLISVSNVTELCAAFNHNDFIKLIKWPGGISVCDLS